MTIQSRPYACACRAWSITRYMASQLYCVWMWWSPASQSAARRRGDPRSSRRPRRRAGAGCRRQHARRAAPAPSRPARRRKPRRLRSSGRQLRVRRGQIHRGWHIVRRVRLRSVMAMMRESVVHGSTPSGSFAFRRTTSRSGTNDRCRHRQPAINWPSRVRQAPQAHHRRRRRPHPPPPCHQRLSAQSTCVEFLRKSVLRFSCSDSVLSSSRSSSNVFATSGDPGPPGGSPTGPYQASVVACPRVPREFAGGTGSRRGGPRVRGPVWPGLPPSRSRWPASPPAPLRPPTTRGRHGWASRPLPGCPRT